MYRILFSLLFVVIHFGAQATDDGAKPPTPPSEPSEYILAPDTWRNSITNDINESCVAAELECIIDEELGLRYQYTINITDPDNCFNVTTFSVGPGTTSGQTVTHQNGITTVSGTIVPFPGNSTFSFAFSWNEGCPVCPDASSFFYLGQIPFPECPCVTLSSIECVTDPELGQGYEFVLLISDEFNCYRGEGLKAAYGEIQDVTFAILPQVTVLRGTYFPSSSDPEFCFEFDFSKCGICNDRAFEFCGTLPSCGCLTMESMECRLDAERGLGYDFTIQLADPEGCYGGDGPIPVDGGVEGLSVNQQSGITTITGTYFPASASATSFCFDLDWSDCGLCDESGFSGCFELPRCEACIEVEPLTCAEDGEGFNFVVNIYDPEQCYSGDGPVTDNGVVDVTEINHQSGVTTITGVFYPNDSATEFCFTLSWNECQLCGVSGYEGCLEFPDCTEPPVCEVLSAEAVCNPEGGYTIYLTITDPDHCLDIDAIKDEFGEIVNPYLGAGPGVTYFQFDFIPWFPNFTTSFTYRIEKEGCQPCEFFVPLAITLPICGDGRAAVDDQQELEATKSAITVSPNPVTDRLILEVPASVIGTAQVELYDMTQRQQFHAVISSGRQTLTTEALIPGLYVVIVRDASGEILLSEKVIKLARE